MIHKQFRVQMFAVAVIVIVLASGLSRSEAFLNCSGMKAVGWCVIKEKGADRERLRIRAFVSHYPNFISFDERDRALPVSGYADISKMIAKDDGGFRRDRLEPDTMRVGKFHLGIERGKALIQSNRNGRGTSKVSLNGELDKRKGSFRVKLKGSGEVKYGYGATAGIQFAR
ncbi:MAG: hypothetical protein AAGK09_11380 [Planctomycetota bacterium]